MERSKIDTIAFLRSSFLIGLVKYQDIANDCGLVMADPTNIHQIIMNLCSNAYHAMEETGGTLSVTLNRIEWTGEDVVGMDM